MAFLSRMGLFLQKFNAKQIKWDVIRLKTMERNKNTNHESLDHIPKFRTLKILFKVNYNIIIIRLKLNLFINEKIYVNLRFNFKICFII